MILLDTSVLVAAYRRKPPHGKDSSAASRSAPHDRSGMALGIPAIVLQEVLAGVRNKTQFQELHTHLTAFRILPATIEDHVEAAQIAAVCSAKRSSLHAVGGADRRASGARRLAAVHFGSRIGGGRKIGRSRTDRALTTRNAVEHRRIRIGTCHREIIAFPRNGIDRSLFTIYYADGSSINGEQYRMTGSSPSHG